MRLLRLLALSPVMTMSDSHRVEVGNIVEHEELGCVRITDLEERVEAVGPNGVERRVGVKFETGLESAFFGDEVMFWDDFKIGIVEVLEDGSE